MQLKVKEMDENFARQILQWEYEEPYDFYNNELSLEGIEEFLSNTYSAIVDDEENLVGFFCTGEAAQVPKGRELGVYKEELLDIGLGMKPDLTGNGFGSDFLSFILSHINEKHLRLTVASFNSRAIHLYEKLGFVIENEFDYMDFTFITMVRKS